MCLNCCGCCPTFKSRYKGLVDNIFPANAQDGLVKNNMEKLTFYALSSPEKLDRIGEYLAQRVARDLSRHRIGYVHIAMQAMDQLLVACHAQSLNLFIESFLKIIQQLLETTDYQMQLLATSSFIRFANIEEDTPSYHRRIPAFVDYVEEVIKTRDNNFKYLLPEYNPLTTNLDDMLSLNHSISAGDSEVGNVFKFDQDIELIDNLPLKYHLDDIKFEQLNDSLIFNKNNVIEALLSSGHDTTLLQTPFITGQTVVDSKMSLSTSDLNSIKVEVDSISSSPGLPRRRPEENITFESFRKFLTDNSEQEMKNAKRIQLVESYKTVAFEDLVYIQERKASDLQNKLSELFTKLTNMKEMGNNLDEKSSDNTFTTQWLMCETAANVVCL